MSEVRTESLEEMRALAAKVAKDAAATPAPVCSAEIAPLPEPATQPFLFDQVDIGCELLTIDDDRKANKHTGTTLEKRQELYDQLCERLVAGVSIRKICRLYSVGRNTVRAILGRLEASGKVEPLKKRLAQKYGEAIELGTDLWLERLEDGTVPVQSIPIAVGIFADKKALLEGEPTQILGNAGAKKISIEDVNGFWERMKTAKRGPAPAQLADQVIELPAAPADSESTERRAKA